MERLPVPVRRQLPARQTAPLPSLILGGMAALVVGKAARWAIGELASGLLNRALEPRPSVAPAHKTQTITLPPGSRVVTRVWWQTEVYVPPASKPKRRFGLF